MICEKCIHTDECFEKRGRCTSFKTPKQARKEIKDDVKRINANYKKAPAGTGADESEKSDAAGGEKRDQPVD